MSEARNWTPEQIGEMTLYQFASVIGHGRLRKKLRRVTKSAEELNERLRWHQEQIDNQERERNG